MENSDEQAKMIISRYGEIWMGLDSVTSIGVGKTDEGKTTIIISLEKDIPATRDVFPAEIEGVPVQIRISGTTKPL
ncbi:MAG: hypothetical protein EA408_11185 [Marinilabiliales bacterium]|nr:MAG: hypothetical protein EA408_11185 [Marinilabiliales bacterium]